MQPKKGIYFFSVFASILMLFSSPSYRMVSLCEDNTNMDCCSASDSEDCCSNQSATVAFDGFQKQCCSTTQTTSVSLSAVYTVKEQLKVCVSEKKLNRIATSEYLFKGNILYKYKPTLFYSPPLLVRNIPILMQQFIC